jgi:nitroreductase
MASEIIRKLQWRYATKKFDATKKLSPEKLDILKEAFNLTATSYGLQPLKMVIVSEDKMKEALVPMTMNQPQVKDCSHVLVLCIEAAMTSEYIKKYFNKIENLRKTPREVLAPFESFLTTSFSEKTETEITSWMSKQAYLALGNLLTVCAMEEIDACPLEGFEPSKYDEYLGLKALGLKSVLLLAVGSRAEDDIFSGMEKIRRGVDRVVIEM